MSDESDGSSHADAVRVTDRLEPHEPSPSELVDIREATPRLLPEACGVPDGCPQYLSACGCDDCFAAFHGALSPAKEVDSYMTDACSDPVTCRVGDAVQRYAAYADTDTERYDNDRLENAQRNYKRVGAADRAYVDDWGDDTTTALLSLRTSPMSPDGRRLRPPGAIANDIMENWSSGVGTIRYELRRAVQTVHGIAPDDWGYIWTLTGTDFLATPHLHVYAWIRDSEDAITPESFRDTVAAHVNNCQGALWEKHPVDGDGGAVSVEHSPVPPEAEIVSEAVGKEGERFRTFGAFYVAKQIPHLILADLRDPDRVVDIEDERRGEVLTACWAEAIAGDTFGSSRGLRQDDDDHGEVRFAALQHAVMTTEATAAATPTTADGRG